MKNKLYFPAFLVLLTAILLCLGKNALGFPVGNDLKQRTWRDGADQITFIDLTHTLPKDGKIISWSFYAQMYANGVYNKEPRNVKLLIFRNMGSGYILIRNSPYYTVEENGWDKTHKMLLKEPIYVKRGDHIGWYYPTQGMSPVNGGVIAFTGNTYTRTVWRWNQLHTKESEEPMAIGYLIPYSQLSGEDQGRTYSIQVDVSLLNWWDKIKLRNND